VPSLPLIASSIMSKKLAAGAKVIVLDVKTGSGAFMRERDGATALARAMVDIGTAAGRRMAAVVSDMSQPLGRMVGNALEMREALDTLSGSGPPEFTAFALELATQIVALARGGTDARTQVEHALSSGAGLGTLRAMVLAQGGDPAAFDDRACLPTATLRQSVIAPCDGYLAQLDALTVARASIALGAGRERKGDPIDLAVGVELLAKVGDEVARGEPLAVLHANDATRLPDAERLIHEAIAVSDMEVAAPPLILDRI
jgi:pyrimidine-nucleoside phosphorylase